MDVELVQYYVALQGGHADGALALLAARAALLGQARWAARADYRRWRAILMTKVVLEAPHAELARLRAATEATSAAQAAHAALLAGSAYAREAAWGAWTRDGAPLALRRAASSALESLAARYPASAVRDAGFTQVAAGSLTVVAIPPGAPDNARLLRELAPWQGAGVPVPGVSRDQGPSRERRARDRDSCSRIASRDL